MGEIEAVSKEQGPRSKARTRKARPTAKNRATEETASGLFSALEAARTAGLLDSAPSRHLSFRAPEALIDAAMRETGVDSPTQLGILALATVAQPDPVVAFMKRNRGRLGEDAGLDY